MTFHAMPSRFPVVLPTSFVLPTALAHVSLTPGRDTNFKPYVDGVPVVDQYALPIGPRGIWGKEWVSFFQIDGDKLDPLERGALHLLQLTPGRCTFFAVVNGYQSSAANPLNPEGLIRAFQSLMEKVGKPLQENYDPRAELREVYEAHGGRFELIPPNMEKRARDAVDEGKVVLVFERGGTRSVAKTHFGTYHVLNHFAKPMTPQVVSVWPLGFVLRYEERYSSLALEPEIVARMLGLR